MTASTTARLVDFASALRDSEYRVATRELAGEPVLLAESPYALVAILEVVDCVRLRERVADVQAALTKLSASDPSPRSWDLYLMVHVLEPITDPADHLLLEEIEADTRYVRKFVRVGIRKVPSTEDSGGHSNDIDRALRPLLPLRPSPQFDLRKPLEDLRLELYELDAPSDLVDTAIDSFRVNTKVTVL
jgi:hypothetical protein